MAHSHGANGNVMGRANMNPILDTRMYQVAFAGGKVIEKTINIIAEPMYAQCDADGNEYLLLDTLVDHHKDNKMISLTNQHQICCQWKAGFTSWEKLSELKESHPRQMTEFAVVQGIYHKPASNCWVKHVFKK